MTEVSVEPTTHSRGQTITESYEDEGVINLCVLTTAPEGEVDPITVSEFVQWNEISHPVMGDPDQTLARHGVFAPMEVLIGPDLTVVAMGDLPISDVWMRNEIEKHLGN